MRESACVANIRMTTVFSSFSRSAGNKEARALRDCGSCHSSRLSFPSSLRLFISVPLGLEKKVSPETTKNAILSDGQGGKRFQPQCFIKSTT